MTGYLQTIRWFITPFDFSPTVLLCSLLALGWYGFGFARWRNTGQSVRKWRSLLYVTGIALMYVALQTQFDYWSQHMFFISRAQQFIVHYMAPFMALIAAPGSVLKAALPARIRNCAVNPRSRMASLQYLRRIILDPVLMGIAFAGLMILWLIPPIHFVAMLNVPLYDTKNWSMAISGFLFWGLILDPRSPRTTDALGYGHRIAALVGIMIPQGAVSAAIALSPDTIYSVYATCGRLWPISPMTDQRLGGLMALPAALICLAAMIIVFRRMLNEEPQPGMVQPKVGPGKPSRV